MANVCCINWLKHYRQHSVIALVCTVYQSWCIHVFVPDFPVLWSGPRHIGWGGAGDYRAQQGGISGQCVDRHQGKLISTIKTDICYSEWLGGVLISRVYMYSLMLLLFSDFYSIIAPLWCLQERHYICCLPFIYFK